MLQTWSKLVNLPRPEPGSIRSADELTPARLLDMSLLILPEKSKSFDSSSATPPISRMREQGYLTVNDLLSLPKYLISGTAACICTYNSVIFLRTISTTRTVKLKKTLYIMKLGYHKILIFI